MGNDSTKSNSTKGQKPATAVASSKAGDNTKHVLILYKPWSERAGEIMEYFYDALNGSSRNTVGGFHGLYCGTDLKLL